MHSHRLIPVALLFTGTIGFAQSPILNPFGGAPAPPERGGFYLYNVAVFGQYSSNIVPLSYAFSPGSALVGADGAIGGAAGVGWFHPGRKGHLSFFYNPSYIGMARHSELNSLNQTMSMSFARRLRSRWTLGASAAASDASIEQYLFTPALFSDMASIPATASDLNAALLRSATPNNAQLSSLLAGTPPAESPARSLLYGRRVLTAAGRANLIYAWSPRLSVRLGFGMLRLQDLPSRNTPRQHSLLAQSTSGSADADILYLLTPRTQTGVSVTSSRNVSRLRDSYINTVSGLIAKTLSRHWFAQARAGIGVVAQTRQLYTLPTGPQYIAGASVGYRSQAHAVLASLRHTAGDVYAYGAGSTVTAQAAWNWHRNGSNWALFASFGEQRFLGRDSRDTAGWTAAAGFSRALSAQTAVQAQYALLNDSLFAARTSNSISVHSVRVVLVWSPGARLW